MKKIKLIALMGKAGSGKDTLLQAVTKKYPEKFHEIVSCTTRPPREGEQNGINYHFLSVEDFTEKLLNGDLLEATEFRGRHYGTLLSTLSQEKINIGVFNPDGIICLQDNSSIDLNVFYITCSDKVRLIRQLNREKNPDVQEIIRRYGTDEEDFFQIEDDIPSFIVYNNETKSDIYHFVKLLGQNY